MASTPPAPAAANAAANAAAPAPKQQQQQQWRRARVETTIKLSTTGGTVWGAAESAIAFFERHWDDLVDGHQQKKVRVLELGAGCGKLGLTLALNRGASCSVLLTEQPNGGALGHLERNVRVNGDDDLEDLDARAAACDWADFVGVEGAEEGGDEDDGDDQKEETCWRTCERVSPLKRLGSLPCADVIIGSDLIYLLEGARALPRTIAALLWKSARRRDGNSTTTTPAPVAYYSHTRHRFDALDVEFEEQCVECGLELVEMDAETGKPVNGGDGGGAAASSSSPPPFSELFPEHRVAMYRLRLLEDGSGD